MEVTQKDDHITHAVAGQHETIEMGMSSSAALMHIMSAALYTHPELAAVREPICNGWDAHISAGKTDTNLVIEVNERSFSVRDFGLGIPHEKIGPIYGTYGDSTKRDDETVTGGFGLGSKAPFAYMDIFEVVSCHEGTKTIYRVSKSSMEKGGKPAIHKVVAMPTDETGITVSFALKEGHRDKFLRLVKEVVTLGGIKATINEGLDNVIPLPTEESPTGYLIHGVRGTVTATVNIRYGNVVYPIPERTEYASELRRVEIAISNLWRGASIIFMAAPNTVSIAPSRENLILTDGTIETIKKALSQFDDKMLKKLDVANHQNLNALYNKALKAEPVAENYIELVKPVKLTIPSSFVVEKEGPIFAFTLKSAAQRYFITTAVENYNGSYGESVYYQRLAKLLKARACNQGFGNALIKILRRDTLKKSVDRLHKLNYKQRRMLKSANEVVAKHIAYPLYQAINSNPKMSKDRLSFLTNVGWSGANLEKLKNCEFASLGALQFVFPKVLIATNVKSIDDFFKGINRQEHISTKGWFVYRTASSEGHINAAVNEFTKLGYAVTCIATPPVKREVDPNAPVKPKVVKKAKPKKHLLSLNQAYDKWNDTYLLSHARKNVEGDCVDPLAYVILRSKDSYKRHNQKIPCLSVEQTTVVRKMIGDSIAVVTATQADALKSKGVVSVQEMIQKYVAERLVEKKDFPSYMAFGAVASNNESYNTGITATRWGVLKEMCMHKTLMSNLGLRFHLSTETALLVKFVEEEGDIFDFCSEHKVAHKVKTSPLLQKAYDLLQDSDWAKFVNIKAVKDALSGASEELTMDSIPVKLIRELIPFKKLHSKQVAT